MKVINLRSNGNNGKPKLPSLLGIRLRDHCPVGVRNLLTIRIRSVIVETPASPWVVLTSSLHAHFWEAKV